MPFILNFNNDKRLDKLSQKNLIHRKIVGSNNTAG